MEDHTLLKDPLLSWCSILGSCFFGKFSLCHFLVLLVLSYSLQLKKDVLGFLSLASGALWGGFGVDFTFTTLKHRVSSLAILEIPFVEEFFKRMAFCVKLLWDKLVCFEFFLFLVHLLMDQSLLILLPCCISEGDSWVLGCRCFTFFETVFVSESASSFSSIPSWAGQYTILTFCSSGLMPMKFSWIAPIVESWYFSPIMIFLLYFTFLVFLYYSICSTLLFLNHLLQVSCSHSSIIHSDGKNHNVFCKKLKCEVNLYNWASVQDNYLRMIANKKRLKRVVSIFFKKNCFNFIFVASFHKACAYLCLNFWTKNINFWP